MIPTVDSKALLNCLRGVLALSIIWHHLQPVPLTLFKSGDLYFLISVPGRIVVWVFFVLSGYSIYFGYMNGKYHCSAKDIFRFYFNRCIRILPLFYITTFASIFLIMKAPGSDFPTWQSIVRTLFFLDINLYHGINAFTPGWFVGVIIHFYILAPFLVAVYSRLHHRAGNIWMFIIVAVVSIICHRLGRYSAGSYDIRNIIGGLPLFLWGFFAYELCSAKTPNTHFIMGTGFRKLVSIFCLVLFFEYIFYCYAFDRWHFWKRPFELFVGIGSVMLIYLIIQMGRQTRLTRNPVIQVLKAFAGKVLGIFGGQAYGLYLWHGIIIIILSRGYLFVSGEPPFATFKIKFIYFLLTVVMSYVMAKLFYHILEKPFHRLYILKGEVASVSG